MTSLTNSFLATPHDRIVILQALGGGRWVYSHKCEDVKQALYASQGRLRRTRHVDSPRISPLAPPLVTNLASLVSISIFSPKLRPNNVR